MQKDVATLRVLLADDSEAVRTRLADLLGALPGASIVGQSGTAGDALDQLRELAPDVLLLDLSMSGGGGLGVLRGMREEKLSCVVIILTNYASPEYEQLTRQLGAQFFFRKSDQVNRAVETVRQLAERSQRPTPRREPSP